MKVLNADIPMSRAEQTALDQLQDSERRGQVIWHPNVARDKTAPDCVACFEQIGRFAIRFLHGQYSVIDDQWVRCDNDRRDPVPVDDPLDTAWEAAMAARDEIIREHDFGCYIVAVAVFVDMDPEQDIIAAADGRGAKILWGTDNIVDRLIHLLPQEKRQASLKARFISKDVAALTRPAEMPTEPESEPVSVDLGSGPLVLNGVENVVIHVTINITGTDRDGDAPPLITVAGD